MREGEKRGKPEKGEEGWREGEDDALMTGGCKYSRESSSKRRKAHQGRSLVHNRRWIFLFGTRIFPSRRHTCIDISLSTADGGNCGREICILWPLAPLLRDQGVRMAMVGSGRVRLARASGLEIVEHQKPSTRAQPFRERAACTPGWQRLGLIRLAIFAF